MLCICLRCTNYYFETIAKLDHNYVGVVSEPTCTEQGYTTFTCLLCGHSYVDDYVSEEGHDWNESVITIEPSEDSEGLRTFFCLHCDIIRTEVIPKLFVDNKLTVELIVAV